MVKKRWKKSFGLKTDSNLNIRNHNNIKIIVPKELKLKNIQKVIENQIPPKCQLNWDTFYEKQLSGNQFGKYWTRLNVSKSLSSSNGNVCISFIVYSEYRLQKNGKIKW